MSAAERRFLIDGVASEIRNDGRASGTFRRVVLETGVLEQTSGSARVRVGASDVTVGVKLQVAVPHADAPNVGLVECGVECAPLVAADAASTADLAQSLHRAWAHGRCLDLAQLCIAPGKLCWCVYVDAVVHSGDGNLLDVLSIAARAALHNTRVPAVRAVPASSGDAGLDAVELEVDSDVAAGAPLNLARVPVCVTLTRIGKYFVVDATREEQLCSSGSLTVAINAHGRTTALEKRGSASIDPGTVFSMLHTARTVGMQLLAAVDQQLAQGAQVRGDARGWMN
jgi:exosome complex component RRP42